MMRLIFLINYNELIGKLQTFAKLIQTNRSSTDIKLSKTHLSNMLQSGGFLGRLLGSLLKTELPLIKNVIKPLDKSILIPLGLTTAASAADSEMHKKHLWIRSSKYNTNNIK